MGLYCGGEKVKICSENVPYGLNLFSTTHINGGYTNQVPLSTDAEGNIYNGCGYKYGYRTRSGGGEAADDGSITIGFIPCKSGDVVRVWDASGNSIYRTGVQNAINYSDSSKTNLGQIVGNTGAGYGICEDFENYSNSFANTVTIGADNSWTFTVMEHPDIAYLRLTVYNGVYSSSYNLTGSKLIVTVNEEII